MKIREKKVNISKSRKYIIKMVPSFKYTIAKFINDYRDSSTTEKSIFIS